MIPHLEQQIAFLTACRDHGLENVEWRNRRIGMASGIICPWSLWSNASDGLPEFHKNCDYEFRIRPRTYVIPRAEVPAPLKEHPKRNSAYYVVNVQEEEGYDEIRWRSDDVDLRWLKSGICYATPEDAAAAARAMLAREEE